MSVRSPGRRVNRFQTRVILLLGAYALLLLVGRLWPHSLPVDAQAPFLHDWMR